MYIHTVQYSRYKVYHRCKSVVLTMYLELSSDAKCPPSGLREHHIQVNYLTTPFSSAANCTVSREQFTFKQEEIIKLYMVANTKVYYWKTSVL